jgi:protein TonB
MNFSQQEQTLGKRFGGLTIVILLHVVVLYALVSGLAKRVVDVVRAPIETKVIEEVKAPPPPEIVVPPPPKLEAPPPPFIPPPEVQITAPVPVQPTITTSTPTPPAVVELAPVAPPAPVPVAPAPPPPKPVLASIGVACQKLVAPIMPPRAVEEGINGTVKARITIRNSKVVSVDIVSAKPRGVFDAAVKAAMMKYSCQTDGDQTVTAEQDFQFKLDE